MKLPDATNEDIVLVRESFIRYRNAGIALSVTIISLAILLFKGLLDEQITRTIWSDICKGTLIASVLSAFSIQSFHYLGAREQAQTYLGIFYFKSKTYLQKEQTREDRIKQFNDAETRSEKANKLYGVADRSVYVSIALLAISFFLWMIAT